MRHQSVCYMRKRPSSLYQCRYQPINTVLVGLVSHFICTKSLRTCIMHRLNLYVALPLLKPCCRLLSLSGHKDE